MKTIPITSNTRFGLKACVLAMSVASSQSAVAAVTASPISVDFDGKGGDAAVTVGSFDWTVGSVLAVDTIPFPAAATQSFQTYAQGKFGSYKDPDGVDHFPPSLITTPAEITFAIAFGEDGTSNATQDDLKFRVNPDPGFTNFIEFYYDDFSTGVKANPLAGVGFNDGKVILKGKVLEEGTGYDGGFKLTTQAIEVFDDFIDDDYFPTKTVEGDGSQSIVVLVTDADPDFFPDLGNGSLISVKTQQSLRYLQTNPDLMFASQPQEDGGALYMPTLGAVNGVSGPDMEFQSDPSNSFTPIEEKFGCRVTGGGNDTAGITYDAQGEKLPGWNGSTGSGSSTQTQTIVTVKGKSGKVTTETITETNVYTFGGQAGANTGQQPQPKGELEHVNHEGPAGQWAFHMGTASAPPGTEIDTIVCSDPGWCRQARPAPTKQIDFAGIGTFRNIIDDGNLNDGGACATLTETTGKPSDRTLGTYNWAEVHIEDRGEPGREGQHEISSCPADGAPTDAFDNYFGAPEFNTFTCEADGGADCPDFYRIRIYCGIPPEFDGEGNLTNYNAIKAQRGNKPIYEVYGYIDGGNWQIHPLTGFDLHRR